jgi:hypothetical protein
MIIIAKCKYKNKRFSRDKALLDAGKELCYFENMSFVRGVPS